MRKYFYFFALFFAIACGNPQEEKETNPRATEQQDDRVAVSVKSLKSEKFVHYFTVNGTIEAVNSAFISPEMNGQIKKIHVVEGQRVKKDQLLVSLNASVIKSGIEEAKTSLALARKLYEKQKKLFEQNIGSEIQFLETQTKKETLESRLKSLKSQLAMTQIKAPFSGIIDKITQKEGELAAAGLQLIQLVNLSEIKINIDVSEAYLSKIKKGDEVNIEFPSYPEMKRVSKISRIGNIIHPQNRTFEVEVKLHNKDEKLKPNMLAVIKLMDFNTDKAILVPSIIVKEDLSGKFVYIVNEKNTTAEKVYIKTGISDDKNTLVKQGLAIGNTLIIDGFNLVRQGTKVTER